MPFDAVIFADASLLTLAVFNLEFLVRSDFLIAFMEGADNMLPEPLGFAGFLVGDGLDERRSRYGVGCVKEEFLLAGL